MKKCIAAVAAIGLAAAIAAPAQAVVSFTTQHGPDATSLDGLIRNDDLINGLLGTELPGDLGWHPANTNPADRLPALTDGLGILASGLTGLLNDFPGSGNPTKKLQYDLAGPSDIAQINILTGNLGRDGRVFSTTVVRTSTDGGTNFGLLGYFQSDPSGTVNAGQWGSTFVSITADAGELAGVTNIQFDLYAVDNTQGQMRDPFDGVNPFTGLDDGLSAPIASPLVFEIDVVIPEPGSLALLSLAGIPLLRRRRN